MKRLHPPLDFQVALFVALFGGLWILFSDYLLSVMVRDSATLLRLQTYKDWMFVAASALLIFVLLRRELTLRQVTEGQLRESEERYRLLFQNSMDAILLTSPDGSIYDVNPAACGLFGRTEEEILQVGRNGLVDVTDPRLMEALEERANTGRFHGVLTFIRKDGSKFEGEVSSNLFRTQDVLERTSMIIRDITERKRTDERLRLSEERFSKAFFASPAGMTITRIADGKFIDVNESFLRVFEFSREEVIGHTSTELNMWTPEERHKLIQAQIETGGLQDFELQAQSKTGRIISILFSSKPIDLEGETCHITTMIEITERKQVKEALRESEDKFKYVFETANVGKSITLPTGEIFVNKAFAEMLGYSQEELAHKTWQELTPPDEIESIQEALAPLLNGEKDATRIIKRYIHKNGSFLWADVSAAIRRGEDGKPLHFITTIVDITERRQAEEALRKSEQTFSVIFKRAPFAAGLASLSDGAYLEVNDEFERVFGFSRQEIVGKTSLELGIYPDADVRERSAAMFREQGFVHNLDMRLQTRTGEVYDVLINSDLVEIRGEKYILTTANDITERKHAEEQLRLSRDSLQELSRRLVEVHETERRGIGRELHDQIGQMLTALDLTLAIAPQLPPEQAARKLGGAQELVHDLSERVSRLSLELRPPMLDDLGLIPALLWHVNRYQEQADIQVDLRHSHVEGSRFRPEIENTAYRLIQEALTNVARHARASRVRLEIHAQDGQLEIKIEDDGQGFDVQTALARHRGLSGMRERAGLLDGEFQVESENEEGTKILIKLPLAENST